MITGLFMGWTDPVSQQWFPIEKMTWSQCKYYTVYHNWEVMWVGTQIKLIPSFDHGLSLGGTDKLNLSVEKYASRYKSPFQGNNQQLSTKLNKIKSGRTI